MKKQIFILIIMVISTVFLNSCRKTIFGVDKYSTISGTITNEETGEPIENAKLIVYTDDFNRTTNSNLETGDIAYSDEEGHYSFEFKRKVDDYYFIRPTHDSYVFGVVNGWYPTVNGGESEINFEMQDKFKIKIEGDVRYEFEDTFIWLDSVKISILKRPNGNSNYPEATGIETYSNNGLFYIEYEGDENYEFFIKPEKNEYYYLKEDLDYKNIESINPGHIKNVGFFMKKEE